MDSVWRSLARTALATVPRTGYAAHAGLLQRLIESIPDCTTADRTLMHAAIEQLYATQGRVRIEQLAAQCCLSRRQFERRFKLLAGISPKLLARLIRFEAIRDRLLHDPWCRLINLAYEFGYTDQSHFIRDFKIFTAFTPGEFAERALERGMSQMYYLPDPRQPYHVCVGEQE